MSRPPTLPSPARGEEKRKRLRPQPSPHGGGRWAASDLPPQLLAVRINLPEPSSAQHTLGGLIVLVRAREDDLDPRVLPRLTDQSANGFGGNAFAPLRWRQAVADLDRTGGIRRSHESAATDHLT